MFQFRLWQPDHNAHDFISYPVVLLASHGRPCLQSDKDRQLTLHLYLVCIASVQTLTGQMQCSASTTLLRKILGLRLEGRRRTDLCRCGTCLPLGLKLCAPMVQ